MGNPFQMLGYATLTVAGLCIAVCLLSPGSRLDNTSVETTATLGALWVSLSSVCRLGRTRPAPAAALLLCTQKFRLGRKTVPHDSPPLAVWSGRRHDLDVRPSRAS